MDRTFSVILSAKVDQYVNAMREAKASTTSFSTETEKNLQSVGTKMSSVGKSMTLGVTLPIVALGGAAVNMSMDFERTFSQMVGLAGIPAAEVDKLKGSVMNLSKQTGVSAQELAESLYFASSAGLSTADAMEAVDDAAHASAVGLGSAQDVVGLAATALSSYGSANISASEATDILTKTIKVGRAEPAELAGQLGRILPVAAALGVSFEEVGGITAYMSNAMGDTHKTVTALSGIFNKLIAPTQQGRDALRDYGLSADKVRQTIQDDGLMAALDLLKDSGLAGNSQALRAVFDDVEAYNGALLVLNDNSGTLQQTMDAVADHTGALGDAFAITADTQGFKMKQSFESMRVAMIQAGDAILPIVAGIVDWMGKLVGAFSGLPGPAQGIVLAFLGVAAAAGPLLMIAGSVVRNLSTLTTVAGKLGPALASASPYLLAIAAAATAAYLIYDTLTHSSREVARRTGELKQPLQDATAAIIEEYHAAVDAASSAEGLALSHKALSAALTSTGGDGERFTQALGALGHQASEAADILIDFKKDPVQAMAALGRQAGMTAADAQTLALVVDQTDDNLSSFQTNGEPAREKMKRIAIALAEVKDQAQNTDIEALSQSFLDTAVAMDPLHEKLVRQATDQAGVGATASQVYDKYVDLAAASDELAGASDASASSTQKQAAAIAAAAAPTEDLTKNQQALAEQATAAADAAYNSLVNWTSYQQVISGADWGAAGLNGANQAFGAFSESLFSLGNFVQSQAGAWKTFGEAVDGGALSMDTATEAGAKQQDALEGVSKVLEGQLADAWDKADGNADTFRQSADYISQTTLAGLRDAAGLSGDEVNELARLLGLMPEDIETRIKLAGDAEAQLKLGLLQGAINTLPRDVQMQITQQILAGDYQGAVATAQTYIESHPPTATMQTVLDYEAAARAAAAGQTFMDKNPASLDIFAQAVPASWGTARGETQRNMDQNHAHLNVDSLAGDIFGGHTTIQRNMDAYHVKAPTDSIGWDIWGGRNAIQNFNWLNPTTAPVNSIGWNVWEGRSAVQNYNWGNPTSVPVNAQRGDVSGAWWNIQNWFSSNPVKVTTQISGGRMMASGGRVGVGDAWQIVGEQGPELVSLPPGSVVNPAGKTSALLSAMTKNSNYGTMSAAGPSAPPSGFGGAASFTMVIEGNVYGDAALDAKFDAFGREVAHVISGGKRR